MAEVFAFLLDNFGKVFDYLRSFQLFPGLNLLQFLLVCLVIDVCIMLFFNHLPRANVISGLESTIRKAHRKDKD